MRPQFGRLRARAGAAGFARKVHRKSKRCAGSRLRAVARLRYYSRALPLQPSRGRTKARRDVGVSAGPGGRKPCRATLQRFTPRRGHSVTSNHFGPPAHGADQSSEAAAPEGPQPMSARPTHPDGGLVQEALVLRHDVEVLAERSRRMYEEANDLVERTRRLAQLASAPPAKGPPEDNGK